MFYISLLELNCGIQYIGQTRLTKKTTYPLLPLTSWMLLTKNHEIIFLVKKELVINLINNGRLRNFEILKTRVNINFCVNKVLLSKLYGNVK